MEFCSKVKGTGVAGLVGVVSGGVAMAVGATGIISSGISSGAVIGTTMADTVGDNLGDTLGETL